MTPAIAPPRTPRIVPVLDVKEGEVVRAVGGRRELYAPIRSRLTDSTDPRVVADMLLQTAGVKELYVADIDALEGHRPRLRWVRELVESGCHVLVDAGVRTLSDIRAVIESGADVVIATETLVNLRELQSAIEQWGADRLVLSIDLRNGQVLGSEAAWGSDPLPLAVAETAVRLALHRLIVLELARVGTGIGPGTTELCGQLRQAFPTVELIAGGGVRNWADVDRLAEVGVDGVLVASALHDGAMNAAR